MLTLFYHNPKIVNLIHMPKVNSIWEAYQMLLDKKSKQKQCKANCYNVGLFLYIQYVCPNFFLVLGHNYHCFFPEQHYLWVELPSRGSPFSVSEGLMKQPFTFCDRPLNSLCTNGNVVGHFLLIASGQGLTSHHTF